MRSIKVGILLLIPAAAAANGNRAVQEPNYEARAGYQNRDVGDKYAVEGRLTMPLLKFGGVSLVGGYDRFEGDGGTLDSDTYAAGGEAFLRDYDVGKISARFLYRDTEFDRPSNAVNIDDSSTAKNYTASGEYYYREYTLSASRTCADLEHSDNIKSWGLGGRVYAKENTRLGVSVNRSDDKTSYTFGLAHQPALLRNSTEVSLGYADVGDNDEIYSVSIAYYFDKRPSLIDRDRKYR